MVAVGKSVPGIMITNISMLFGYYVGGWFGGVCAVLGMTCPAVLILSFVTAFYKVLKSNVWCYAALRGIRCAVVPIMGSAALSLGKEAFRRKSVVSAKRTEGKGLFPEKETGASVQKAVSHL